LKITVEGEPISPPHDHDAHFTYVVTLSDAEQMMPEDRMQLIVELVKLASGQRDFLQDRHLQPYVSGWEPYIDSIKPVSTTQWEIQVVYPHTE